MKKMQTFEGFLDWRKDLFKIKFLKNIQRLDELLKDIPNMKKKMGDESCDWFWIEKIEDQDFEFQVRLDKEGSGHSVLVKKVPMESVTHYIFYTTGDFLSKLEEYIETLRVDCKDFIISEEFFEEYPENDIKDLCQDLIDYCDYEYELKKMRALGVKNKIVTGVKNTESNWSLVIPIKRDEKTNMIGNIKPEYMNEIKMLRRRLDAVGLSMSIDMYDPISEAEEQTIIIKRKED